MAERVFVGSLLRGVAWLPGGAGGAGGLAASFRDAETGAEGLGLLSIDGGGPSSAPPAPPPIPVSWSWFLRAFPPHTLTSDPAAACDAFLSPFPYPRFKTPPNAHTTPSRQPRRSPQTRRPSHTCPEGSG